MIKLSVVIITFNEEKNIERGLQSVKGIADEIVVLDSFSKDKTQAICEKHGVKFVQHAFDGHIQQKNRAITYASNLHVLSLDADEALDDTLRKSILEIKNNTIYGQLSSLSQVPVAARRSAHGSPQGGGGIRGLLPEGTHRAIYDEVVRTPRGQAEHNAAAGSYR